MQHPCQNGEPQPDGAAGLSKERLANPVRSRKFQPFRKNPPLRQAAGASSPLGQNESPGLTEFVLLHASGAFLKRHAQEWSGQAFGSKMA
jgi:hypothetical protein